MIQAKNIIMGHLKIVSLIIVFLLSSSKLCEAEEADWQLWSGMFFRKIRPESAFDFSGEYQVRLKNDFRDLKSHFFDFNTYFKAAPGFELNAGYRFTIRPDRNENRLMAGFFWRHGLGKRVPEPDSKGFWITHQVMYQRDFNAKFNDILLASNSTRYALYVLKPINRNWAPLAVAAVMYTWNAEYTGLEKLRFAAGLRYLRDNNDRIKIMYVFEKKNSTDPAQYANIFWLRYEVMF